VSVDVDVEVEVEAVLLRLAVGSEHEKRSGTKKTHLVSSTPVVVVVSSCALTAPTKARTSTAIVRRSWVRRAIDVRSRG
jgi:hypothetical protein